MNVSYLASLVETLFKDFSNYIKKYHTKK